jgi:hypothetical protein
MTSRYHTQTLVKKHHCVTFNVRIVAADRVMRLKTFDLQSSCFLSSGPLAIHLIGIDRRAGWSGSLGLHFRQGISAPL